ncbi:JmjC domain-containing histone demethylation protein 1 [Ceratobasidium sp. 414]|nr:JmjC domain-containing histone demethylation protein 1 [Ceratobasidium sp. 414]
MATRRSSRLTASKEGKQESEEMWDRCAACRPDSPLANKAKTVWAECEACGTWFHWDCVGEGGDINRVDKWYCKTCLTNRPDLEITLLPPARKSNRKRARLDYANIEAGVPNDQSDPNRWLHVIRDKTIHPDTFRRVKGAELTREWLETDPLAMTEPVVVPSPEGLGMRMPDNDFTVSKVAELVGVDTPVEVMDVASQSTAPGWTLGSWAEYYNTPEAQREKIRNVISLEVTGTLLAEQITPPRLVREIDWVEHMWPVGKKGKGQFPKVQLYCLMSVARCWTVFYFVRPTPTNLNAYEKWSGSENQETTWFGDLVDRVIKVELTEGNTMLIPTGWIHCVYTPTDSLVFGGNFLHSYNIATQLRVRDIEVATRVPKKFRFPFFTKICWYAAEKYVRDLKAKEEFSPRVLEGLASLASFLVSEARSIEHGTGKDAREQVPGDRVRDPGALARELRWRVRNARGVDSDGEGGPTPAPAHTTSTKRKRIEEPVVENGRPNGSTSGTVKAETPPVQPVTFRNFVPRSWVEVRRDSAVTTSWVATDSIPEDGEASEAMLVAEDAEGAAELQTRLDTIVRTRRSESREGKVQFERQVIMRTLDVYVWDSSAVGSGAEKDVKTATVSGGQEDTADDTSMTDISMSVPDAQLLKSSSSSVDPASAQADVSM